MNCKFCKTKPVWKFTNQRQLCKKCFVDYFDKKILKTIRKFGGLSNKYLIEEKDIRSKILKKILGQKQVENSKKKVFSVYNLDNASIDIMDCLMNSSQKNLKNFLPSKKNIIRPLYFLSDKEIIIYANINNIKGKIKNNYTKKQKELDKFIKSFEKTNPDIRHGIVNGLKI